MARHPETSSADATEGGQRVEEARRQITVSAVRFVWSHGVRDLTVEAAPFDACLKSAWEAFMGRSETRAPS